MAGRGVREVARRAVLAEITSVAEALFREQGYDATTVDQIAERVGMSQRTFFRHVGTKEDLVLAEFDRRSQRMVDDVRSRPAEEDPWTSLRHAFDSVVSEREQQAARERADLMTSIVETSAALRAAYLDRMDLVQRQLVDVLLERNTNGEDRVTMRALVGAAFASLHAVSENCQGNNGSDTFAADLDRVLARLAPSRS